MNSCLTLTRQPQWLIVISFLYHLGSQNIVPNRHNFCPSTCVHVGIESCTVHCSVLWVYHLVLLPNHCIRNIQIILIWCTNDTSSHIRRGRHPLARSNQFHENGFGLSSNDSRCGRGMIFGKPRFSKDFIGLRAVLGIGGYGVKWYTIQWLSPYSFNP